MLMLTQQQQVWLRRTKQWALKRVSHMRWSFWMMRQAAPAMTLPPQQQVLEL
jgi:hypothetical protein